VRELQDRELNSEYTSVSALPLLTKKAINENFETDPPLLIKKSKIILVSASPLHSTTFQYSSDFFFLYEM
jgi:hypothetical protein